VSVVANVAINVDSRNAVTQLQRFETATKSAAAGVAGLVASLGAGFAFAQLIKSASQFEADLSEIGKTAGASEKQIAGLAVALKSLSAPSKTNLAPSILAAGVKDLVAQGLKLNDAVASMETLGKVAVATNSELTDVTKTGFQLQSALKIKPTELKATFDALAFAGKAGAFELKDMAQFMPTIASAATSLGIQGKDGAVALAAMMQMVRKDAPGAAEASTRLTDALLKMTAPDAVKNFTKFGVDIETVLKKAVKDGINPMDAAIGELIRVTGKDPFKLSQIFGDKEAKLALMSLMKYKEEYEKLKAAAGGTAAAGTVQADFEKSLKTFNGQLQTLQTSGELAALSLGAKLLPILTRLIEEILPIVNGVASFVDGMGQVPKPVIDAAIGIGKVIIQLMLIDKALKIAMATAALFRGAMLLLTAQTTLAGAAALTGQARFLMLSGGIKGAGGVAAAATPLVNGLASALGRLAALGIITVGVNYVSNVVGEAMSLRQLQERRTKGGAAATFKGATRETVVAAQDAQRKNLAALAKKEKARQEKLTKDNALYQMPIIGPLALAAASPFIAGEQNKLLEQGLFAKGVLGLDPSKFKPSTPTTKPDLTQDPPPGVTPIGGKGSNKAADEAKQVAEQIRASQVQLTLAQDLFAIEGRLQEAQLAGNDQLMLARNAQKELAELASQRADIVANKEMPALAKKNVLNKLAIDAATVSNKLGFDLAKIEQDRTKSFGEIIADLEFELKLKSAATEEAREQLRLENELRKLKGQGFTDEQVGQITAKKTQLAAPDTAAQAIEKRIGTLKTEIADLTNIGNIAIKVADGIGAAFGQAFEGLITGSMSAQEALGNFFKSIGDMFINMATEIIAKQMVLITLGFIMKALGLLGSAGKVSDLNAPQSINNPLGVPGDFFELPKEGRPYAKGATFSNGIAKFASGGIVGSPTLFPFANGGAMQMGLMGEAGPEAIMPLQRGADGSLGVRAAMGGNGMGGSSSPILNMNFETSTINGVEYVSRDQLELAMAQTRRQASRDGANKGMAMTLDKIQQSPQTRRRIGM